MCGDRRGKKRGSPDRDGQEQLAAEGLVEVAPHRGAVVANLSIAELDELYGIIWSLETLCAEHAVPHLTDADRQRMQRLVDQMETELRPVEWYALSVAFHRVILVASGWPRCVRIIDECRLNIGRYIIDADFFSSHVGEWRSRNRALFDACRRRDAKAAACALGVMSKLSTGQIREHLQAVLDRQERRTPSAA